MKSSQLQIRVSPTQKRYLQQQAAANGLTVSQWVLEKLGALEGSGFADLLARIKTASGADERVAFAALSDYLNGLKRSAFPEATPEPEYALSQRKLALIASMVEYAAARVGAEPPMWAARVPALEEPLFLTSLKSLQPYLLRSSPVEFKRRNIFVDSSVGARV